MAVVAFISLCSSCSLCSFSPIVSIFLTVLTFVTSSISLEYNACRSVLSSSNGFLISSNDVTRALTCPISWLYCRNLFVVSHRTFTTCLAVNVLSNYVSPRSFMSFDHPTYECAMTFFNTQCISWSFHQFTILLLCSCVCSTETPDDTLGVL